jgi:hypothetical protein
MGLRLQPRNEKFFTLSSEAGRTSSAHLLAEIAEPVGLIEAATDRSAESPLPVLRDLCTPY